MPSTRWIVGGMAAVLVAAVCMRPALTAVGPVLGLIGADTGLSNTMLGLLSALPLLAFAAVSPIVHGPVGRIGIERTVGWALAALAAGSAFRRCPACLKLWVGTAVAGAGIAVCNVLIPVVIRRDHPIRVPLMTAVYSATMGTAAALASGVSSRCRTCPAAGACRSASGPSRPRSPRGLAAAPVPAAPNRSPTGRTRPRSGARSAPGG